ncbi:FtsK/SpoIIIE domain-containing protein [Bifidobacterium xylocopae]|nr:FtsK/SpoIIIE domain-containing protein [Bifidobacterium xylocopae]
MVGQIAPVFAQVGLVVIMLSQGRWLYAALLVPSLIACLAVALAGYLGQRRERRTTTDPSLCGSAADPGSKASHEDPCHVFRSLSAPALEDILPGQKARQTGGAQWQGIVQHWLSQGLEPGPDVQAEDAVIGVCADGPFALNLPREGPHALVAGTTGSGKSVLLQAWCLALACRIPPSRLNFVFLDFKGGSAFNQLSRLPHTAGSVSDLDLDHAVRAIAGIERELKHRERLVAAEGACDADDLRVPPARLIVVIDEFQALRQQLPDSMEHLIQLASLGRSLRMNLIACTQNPMGQVSPHMKANMNLNISLRVREPIQSMELLGTGCAADIGPEMPGAGFWCAGGHPQAFRCSPCQATGKVVDQVLMAAGFIGMKPAAPLFTSPLPKELPAGHLSRLGRPVWQDGHPLLPIGLEDDGVGIAACLLPVQGNIAIIGGSGRGKSTCLMTVQTQLANLSGQDSSTSFQLTCVQPSSQGFRKRRIKPRQYRRECGLEALPGPPRRIWLVDGADKLLEPLSQEPMAVQVRQALEDPGTDTVLTVESVRSLRRLELFPVQVVFPSGERGTDLMSGIPSRLQAMMSAEDAATPGRAVLRNRGSTHLIQCAPSGKSASKS